MKDQARPRLRNRPRQLAQRLRHQPRLQPHVRIAHLAIKLRLRNQRRHRVHHQHIDRTRPHQRLDNLQRLLAIVRLRDQQIVDVHAQLPRIQRIERMLGIHKRRQPARLLRLGDDLQRNRRLARRLRPKDLNHPPPRNPAHTQRRIKRDRPRRNDRNRHNRLFAAQPHDRAFAKLLFDLRERQLYCASTVISHFEFSNLRLLFVFLL